MARPLNKTNSDKRSTARAKPPGVALLAPIEARDLMLATLHRAPFSEHGWLYELKYDGFRVMVRKAGDQVELVSRPGNSLNRSFPDIVAAVAEIPGDFVLDGELTVDTPTGRSDFERLRQRAVTSVASRVRAAAIEAPARLYLFDIMASNGRDLRGLPLVTRKDHLRGCFEDTKTVIFANGIVGAGHWVFEQVEQLDLEGMVAKRLQSTYQRGRSSDWRKIKFSGYSRQAALGWGRARSTS
ncbi:ATP-dependent DNA ligase [Caballeronia sp. EK]|uniref:ATP-dependent DNA ligase n=1 Tax=Caballeronia sp. EK TaxID=2767469 RepID=UPI002107A173|nr:DNA ligase [Caballeronia sp. EK]